MSTTVKKSLYESSRNIRKRRNKQKKLGVENKEHVLCQNTCVHIFNSRNISRIIRIKK